MKKRIILYICTAIMYGMVMAQPPKPNIDLQREVKEINRDVIISPKTYTSNSSKGWGNNDQGHPGWNNPNNPHYGGGGSTHIAPIGTATWLMIGLSIGLLVFNIIKNVKDKTKNEE